MYARPIDIEFSFCQILIQISVDFSSIHKAISGLISFYGLNVIIIWVNATYASLEEFYIKDSIKENLLRPLLYPCNICRFFQKPKSSAYKIS